MQSNVKTEWKKDRVFAITGETNEEQYLLEYSINYRKVVRIYRIPGDYSQILKTSDNKSIFLNSFHSESSNILQLSSRSLKLTRILTKEEHTFSLISLDNKFLFSLKTEFILQKWSLDTGKLLYTYEVEDNEFFEYFFFCSIDSKYLILSNNPSYCESSDSSLRDHEFVGSISIIDIENDVLKKIDTTFDYYICGVAFKKNNIHAYLCDQYGNIYMLNMKTFSVSNIFKSNKQRIDCSDSDQHFKNMSYHISLVNEEKNILVCSSEIMSVIDLEKKEIIKKYNFFEYKDSDGEFTNMYYTEIINDGKIACVFLNYGDIIIIDLET